MKIKAHVPVQQYGFIEIEGTPEEEEVILEAYNRYAEQPVNWSNGNRKLLKAWVGGEVYYDEVAHKYTNEKGDIYLSGSVYAQLGEPEFDTKSITEKLGKKFKVPPQDIAQMWMMKADISNGLGTAIHAALELYGKFEKYTDVFDKEYHLHDHPVIKQAVLSFYKGRKEQAMYEALVVDHKRKYAGQIDRVVKEKDVYYIEDFKTNGELKPAKLATYWKQLSFYASIVEAAGLKVGGLRIHHWNGGDWKTYEHEVLEVK